MNIPCRNSRLRHVRTCARVIVCHRATRRKVSHGVGSHCLRAQGPLDRSSLSSIRRETLDPYRADERSSQNPWTPTARQRSRRRQQLPRRESAGVKRNISPVCAEIHSGFCGPRRFCTPLQDRVAGLAVQNRNPRRFPIDSSLDIGQRAGTRALPRSGWRSARGASRQSPAIQSCAAVPTRRACPPAAAGRTTARNVVQRSWPPRLTVPVPSLSSGFVPASRML